MAAGRVLVWPRAMPLNPYFEQLSRGLEERGWAVDDFSYRRALSGRYGVWHIHFPSFPFRNRWLPVALVRTAILSTLLLLAAARGRPIVWTVHNLVNHEPFHPRLEAAFMRLFTRLLTATIDLSESGAARARELYPALRSTRSAIIFHPHYRAVVAPAPSRTVALERIGLPHDAAVILAFGQIRPYKNVLHLIRVFSSMAGDKLRLVVAGAVLDPAYASEIRAAATDPRIVLRLEHVPDQVAAALFGAATLVVAAYREILNSGAALLALSHSRPILVPRKGAMAELRDRAGPDWVAIFDPPLDAADLGAAIVWATESGRAAEADLAQLSPDRIIDAHAALFASSIALRGN